MLTVGWKLGEVLNKDSKAQSTCKYALCPHNNECLNVHVSVYERV